MAKKVFRSTLRVNDRKPRFLCRAQLHCLAQRWVERAGGDVSAMILATLCYVKHNGKTLMVHRNKKPNDIHEGKWNSLGGKIEVGESPECHCWAAFSLKSHDCSQTESPFLQ
jgi:8-oxo-dGTP pyrophosphatase MutT (NUDIX family)